MQSSSVFIIISSQEKNFTAKTRKYIHMYMYVTYVCMQLYKY